MMMDKSPRHELMLEGLLYDWENDLTLRRQNKDIDFYGSLFDRQAGEGNRVLELGCGTGRVTIPLARMGHSLVGVDLSESRLEVARSKIGAGDKIELVLGDMCRYVADEPFDWVIVPYSAFLLLSDEQQRAECLLRITENLRHDGRAIIDVSPNFLAHPEKQRWPTLAGDCPSLCAHIEYFESVRQDYKRRITYFRKDYLFSPIGGCLTYPGTRNFFVEEVWHTLTVDEMRGLIERSGLHLEQMFGTYELDALYEDEEYVPGSYKNIYLLRG